MQKYLALLLFTLLAALGAGTAKGQALSFEFKNPAFGGSYLNYSWMLQSAEAQKDFEEDQQSSSFNRDPLADFQDSLQRQILSTLTRELVYDRLRDVDLTKEGHFDLGDYTIDIIPGLDGINIKVFNGLTGQESTITVPNF